MKLKGVYIYCLVWLLAAFTYSASAQTFFWTEDFSTSNCNQGCQLPYTGVNGTWTWLSTGVNGTKANTWYISYQEEGWGRTHCGSSGADPSLHVGNVAGSPAAFLFCPTGDCGAAYDASAGTDGTNAMAVSPVINCTGRNTITLSFNYIMKGQAAHDFASVEYYNGVAWAVISNPPMTALCGMQGKWTHFTVALPASANNNAAVQIGFNWTNNTDNIGTDPSFAVDSIQLSVPAVLPVELLEFHAKYDNSNDRVNLDWVTASETNNDYFTVQRSTDGETYTDVTKVKGAGNSSQNIDYNAVDETVTGGIVYYRLKQTDFDGHFAYSAIVPVNEVNPGHIRIYPDPVFSYVNIGFYMEVGETGSLKVFDCAGRLVNEQEVVSTVSGENTFKLDVTNLSRGVYILRMDVGGKSFFNRFVKQ